MALLLLKKRADVEVNARYNDGRTPLSWAAKRARGYCEAAAQEGCRRDGYKPERIDVSEVSSK